MTHIKTHFGIKTHYLVTGESDSADHCNTRLTWSHLVTTVLSITLKVLTKQDMRGD